MSVRLKILAASYDPEFRNRCEQAFPAHWEWAHTADSILALLALESTAALVVDSQISALATNRLFSEVHKLLPNLPILPITKTGKPLHWHIGNINLETLSIDEVCTHLREIQSFHDSLTQVTETQTVLVKRFGTADLLGVSTEMNAIYQLVESLRDTRATVLMQGESGTGKELLARLLHQVSACRKGPFVAINCGAIPEQLLESELFGYERGAFTGANRQKQGLFEAARNGTVLLDEIGELPLGLQVKLLRVLETKRFTRVGGVSEIECEVRVLASTNRDLEQMVAAKTFRDDLFWRLHVVPVELPPLRERGEDIALLFTLFCLRNRELHRRPVWGISEEVLPLLSKHNWSGNVRELMNRTERAVLLAKSPWLTKNDFSDLIVADSISTDGDTITASGNSGGRLLSEIEREAMFAAVAKANGNLSQAARELGISRTTLYKKLQERKPVSEIE